MANVKISELTASGALDGTELVEIVQSGANVQTTAQDIADLGGGGSITISDQTASFTADGATGVVYTNAGSVANIIATLSEVPAIGTEYSFAVRDVFDIWIATPAGTNIVFFDSFNTGLTQTVDTDGSATYLRILAANTGSSVTIVKITSTQWAVTSNCGAEFYAD